jgi:hypothetical protein
VATAAALAVMEALRARTTTTRLCCTRWPALQAAKGGGGRHIVGSAGRCGRSGRAKGPGGDAKTYLLATLLIGADLAASEVCMMTAARVGAVNCRIGLSEAPAQRLG